MALARDPDLEGMLAYKPGHGPWHSVGSNLSQAVEDLLLWLDDDHTIAVTQSERSKKYDIHKDEGV
jgi:hypothetical protein